MARNCGKWAKPARRNSSPNFSPKENRSSSPDRLTAAAGTLFFRANDGVHGRELWRVNPTTLQAEMVPDIWPGSNEGNPDWLTAVGNLLYFTAQDGFSGDAHGTELWRVGATGPASLAGDINPGPNQSQPRNLINVNGTLFLTANDGTNGLSCGALPVLPARPKWWRIRFPAAASATESTIVSVALVPSIPIPLI